MLTPGSTIPPPTIQRRPVRATASDDDSGEDWDDDSDAASGSERRRRFIATSQTTVTNTRTSEATPNIHHQTPAIARADGPAGSRIDCGPWQAASPGRNNTCVRRP